MKKLTGFLMTMVMGVTMLAVPAFADPGRPARQEARIRQGERTGELTPREANRLERREGRIQQEKRDARADGRVTPGERAKIRREENRASRAIYREKHDRQRAPR